MTSDPTTHEPISKTDFALGRPALAALASELRASRDRAIGWLLDRIAGDGAVANSNERNGWARVPWALAIAGETEAAARVLSWIERTELAADGDFCEGPALGDGTFRAYPLAHLAIGAHLAGRHDIAHSVMGALRRLQHPVTGGMNLGIGPADSGFQDLLFTAQAGFSALIAGQNDIADNSYRWITQLWHDQPGPPHVLYCIRAGEALLTEPDPKLALLAITDFTKPRQLYYNPSIAAVFLAKYGSMRGDQAALQLGQDFLELNINGPADQYDDPASVQICKFGWGAAAMMIADPSIDYLPHLVRMGHWFLSRQSTDGSWNPSTFMFESPSDVDKMLKTAEHAVEIDIMVSALGTQLGKAQ